MFPLFYALFLPGWWFGVINLLPFPKSPIHFNVILYYVNGWSGVGLFSNFKMGSKQQKKHTDFCFLLCAMSHSCKNNSRMHTRNTYFLRDCEEHNNWKIAVFLRTSFPQTWIWTFDRTKRKETSDCHICYNLYCHPKIGNKVV